MAGEPLDLQPDLRPTGESDGDDGALEAEGQKRKDAALGKGTLLSLWGIDRARAHLDALVQAADAALADFGDAAGVLRAAARYVAERRN